MTNEISTEVTFTTVAMIRGKGVTAADKVRHAIKNQVYTGVMMSENVNKKAIIDIIAEADVARMTTDVVNAKYARPIATIATVADRATDYMTEAGAIPRTEWLRFGEQLKNLETKRGIKARALWVRVQDAADKVFLERKAARLAAPITE